jgi:polyketide cyclase/dehydrase/lipid transport protein
MGGVQSVQQLDDTHLRWIAEIGGKQEEWEAEITEQHPEERVAWKAIGGKGNAGVVTFHRLNDQQTRVDGADGLAARRRDRERRNGSWLGRPSGVEGLGPVQGAD